MLREKNTLQQAINDYDVKFQNLANQVEGNTAESQNRALEIVRRQIGLALDTANRDNVLLKSEFELIRHEYDKLLHENTELINRTREYSTCTNSLRNENSSIKVLKLKLFINKFNFLKYF